MNSLNHFREKIGRIFKLAKMGLMKTSKEPNNTFDSICCQSERFSYSVQSIIQKKSKTTTNWKKKTVSIGNKYWNVTDNSSPEQVIMNTVIDTENGKSDSDPVLISTHKTVHMKRRRSSSSSSVSPPRKRQATSAQKKVSARKPEKRKTTKKTAKKRVRPSKMQKPKTNKTAARKTAAKKSKKMSKRKNEKMLCATCTALME